MRYSILEETEIDLDLDGGLRFGPGIEPYTQIRASRWFDIDGTWSFEPSQFFHWESRDGFGEKTRFDLNRKLGEDLLARSRSEVVWAEESRGVDVYQELSTFQELSPRRYIGAFATLVAYTEPSFTPDEYRLSVRYRSTLGWPWLVGEIEPGLAFPDDRDHRTTPEITFRIDVYLDRVERHEDGSVR